MVVPSRIVERHGPIGLPAHELAHLGDRTGRKFGGRALSDDLAAGEQIAVVRDRRELAHIVRDDDAGDAEGVVELADQPDDHAHGDRIETDEGLVIDQQLRVHDDRAGQGYPARHAARQLRRHHLGGTAQAHGMQLGQHQLPQHRLRQAGMLADRERHVLEDREVGEQGAILEQHAHPSAQTVEPPGVETGDLLPEDLHAALFGRYLPGDEPQQGCLAGAARPHHRRDAAPARLEVDSREDLACADVVVQSTDLHHGIATSTGGVLVGHPQAAPDSMSAV